MLSNTKKVKGQLTISFMNKLLAFLVFFSILVAPAIADVGMLVNVTIPTTTTTLPPPLLPLTGNVPFISGSMMGVVIGAGALLFILKQLLLPPDNIGEFVESLVGAIILIGLLVAVFK